MRIYLKKVILENFLSFQRDEIDFIGAKLSDLPRLILIIGPNWSGKTSIFQAIKFALGSNERDDRYKKWSDFIRDSQKHAMVELHILCNGKLIKIRRIVLRGKAPYYELQEEGQERFHKVHANELQSIVEEFGINPDNHFAFVSQGKIDAIKSLKPVELCNFIEEGIGLKDLREEILQQKNNVFSLKNDFDTLITKKNTLNFSLELLKPKLLRLEEKQKLLKEKQSYLDELLLANKEKLIKEIDILKEKEKSIQENINRLNEAIKEQLEQIKTKETEISVFEDEISKLTLNKGELSFQKKDFSAQIQTWQSEKQIAKQELEKYAQMISTKEKEYQNLENQHKKVKDEINVISKEEKLLKQEINNLISEQTDLSKKVQENQEFLNSYNSILTEKESLKKKIEENHQISIDTERDINDIFQSIDDINHKLEKNNWFLQNPSKDLMKDFDEQLKKSSLKLLYLNNDLEKLEHERVKNIKKTKELQIALKERRIILPPSINVLKEEIIKRGISDKIKGPIIDFLSYNDELSYAIESVLGERLLHSFIAQDWDTLTLFGKIKDKYNAYCNIYLPKNLPISLYPEIKAEGVIGYLVNLIKVLNNDIDIQKVLFSKIKNCIVVKDYISGKQLYTEHNFKGKCVTLKGEQLISYKYVYENPHIKRLKGLLSPGTQKEQLELLEQELNNINSKIVELKKEQIKLDETQRDIYKKKDLINDLIYSFTQKQRLTEKKNQLYNLIYSLEQSNSDLTQKIELLSNRLIKLEQQTEPDFFKWNDRLKEIPGKLNDLNNTLNKWNLRLTEKRETILEVKDKELAAGNALDSIKNEYNIKKENFKRLDKKAFDIYKKLEILEENLESIDEELAKLRENKLNKRKEITELNNLNLELKFSLEQENFTHSSINHDLREKKEDLERIYASINKLEASETIIIRPIEEIEKDISIINKKLVKYYDVDDSILVEKKQIVKNLKEIMKNQEKLKVDIDAALKTEKKLESTYYNKFKLTLEDLNLKINKKFEEANIKAFCMLSLINTFEDLGIEIKAATSKDQLKTCTALSGGQISMISINMILSLQEIKPSPLCMFDEAGMFLDEKNSEASYHMIKSTLDKNAVQLLMFLPKSSNVLYKLADKLIGVARVGKNERSTIFIPKIVKD